MREILVVFEIENELQRQEFINKIKIKMVKILGYDKRRY